MDRADFIDEIFIFFNSKNENLKRTYDLAFTTKQSIDWNKLYKRVINEAETRYLPTPKWFISQFPYCLKQDFKTSPNDGKKVVVRLKDGYFYEFVLCGCTKTENEIREGLYQKFKRNGTNPIKQIEFYGKDEFIGVHAQQAF